MQDVIFLHVIEMFYCSQIISINLKGWLWTCLYLQHVRLYFYCFANFNSSNMNSVLTCANNWFVVVMFRII